MLIQLLNTCSDFFIHDPTFEEHWLLGNKKIFSLKCLEIRNKLSLSMTISLLRVAQTSEYMYNQNRTVISFSYAIYWCKHDLISICFLLFARFVIDWLIDWLIN